MSSFLKENLVCQYFLSDLNNSCGESPLGKQRPGLGALHILSRYQYLNISKLDIFPCLSFLDFVKKDVIRSKFDMREHSNIILCDSLRGRGHTRLWCDTSLIGAFINFWCQTMHKRCHTSTLIMVQINFWLNSDPFKKREISYSSEIDRVRVFFVNFSYFQ